MFAFRACFEALANCIFGANLALAQWRMAPWEYEVSCSPNSRGRELNLEFTLRIWNNGMLKPGDFRTPGRESGLNKAAEIGPSRELYFEC